MECLDCRYHNVQFAGRNWCRLLTPHPRYAQPSGSDTHPGPDLSPRLHGLLAQLIAIRNPEDAATVHAIANRLDNSLDSNARLARARRQAEHSPTRRSVVAVVNQTDDLINDASLIAVQ